MTTPQRSRDRKYFEVYPPEVVEYGQTQCYNPNGSLAGTVHHNTTDMYRLNYDWSRCVDECHRRSSNHWREGGPMTIYNVSQVLQRTKCHEVVYYASGSPKYDLRCDLFPSFKSGQGNRYSFPGTAFPADSWLGLGSYGAQAWNKYKPAKPAADLGVFLAELRDFPSLFKLGVRRFKDLGSAYLNYEFGWKPFLSDIRKGLATYKDLHRRLIALRNANGKWILRKGPVASTNEVLETWERSGYWPFVVLPPSDMADAMSPGHKIHGFQQVKSEIWFSGRFRFFIPGLDGLIENSPMNAISRRMFGLRITPSVLWNVMPWSWLVDWVSNVGDVMSNMSDADINLAAKYAYVCGYMTHSANLMGTGVFKTGGSYTAGITRSVTYKGRHEASPFGFGLSDGDFSVRQWAILAALGISR